MTTFVTVKIKCIILLEITKTYYKKETCNDNMLLKSDKVLNNFK